MALGLGLEVSDGGTEEAVARESKPATPTQS